MAFEIVDTPVVWSRASSNIRLESSTEIRDCNLPPLDSNLSNALKSSNEFPHNWLKLNQISTACHETRRRAVISKISFLTLWSLCLCTLIAN
jgi:hypothetical protein